MPTGYDTRGLDVVVQLSFAPQWVEQEVEKESGEGRGPGRGEEGGLTRDEEGQWF